jgi:PAS domain S-box-containing protein
MQLTAEIDHRAKTEIALREAESRYRALFNNSFELIGLLDPEGILLEVNQTALSMINVNSDEVVGKPFWDGPWWTHDEAEYAKCKKAVKDAASGGAVRLETIHIAADGQMRYIDFTIKPIPGENGMIKFLISEGSDITNKKLAQKEAEERQRQLIHTDKMASLGLMVSGLAHEINNPNNLIMLNADVMEKMWGELRRLLDNVIMATPQSQEVARNVAESAKGLSEVSRNISGVSDAASDTARGIVQVKTSSDELAKLSESLKSMIAQFKV